MCFNICFCFFTWHIGMTIGITSSAIGLNICAKTSGIKKYKSVIKKNKNKTIK